MDIYINPLTHDIDITNRRMRLVRTEEELVRQRLAITLSAFKGEWFANIQFGIPYLSAPNSQRPIFDKSSQNILDFEIRRAILNTEGVVRITSYSSEMNKQTRKITVNFSAETESGEIVSTSTEI